jgi:large subunit ribosomal protein L29
MKTSELTGMSDDELMLALRDTEKHLFQLRFQSATDRLETPSEIAKAKRQIARVKTIQRARELTKLAALPDADIATQLTAIQARTEGPGKRRAKRAVARLQAIQATRPKATTGSGK